MRLDAKADNGSVYVNEIEGGTGLGTIEAGQNIGLTTNGDVTDVRTDEEKTAGKDNIKAEGEVKIETIADPETNPEGFAVGTKDDPIEVSIGKNGHMTIKDQGDINVNSDDPDDDLYLTAVPTNADAVVNVHSEGNLRLTNTNEAAGGTGNMNIHDATAGKNVIVEAKGDVTEGSTVIAG